ncbi:hypothetical protein MHYP_G00135380 [Metynnis hypsauchen]
MQSRQCPVRLCMCEFGSLFNTFIRQSEALRAVKCRQCARVRVRETKLNTRRSAPCLPACLPARGAERRPPNLEKYAELLWCIGTCFRVSLMTCQVEDNTML